MRSRRCSRSEEVGVSRIVISRGASGKHLHAPPLLCQAPPQGVLSARFLYFLDGADSLEEAENCLRGGKWTGTVTSACCLPTSSPARRSWSSWRKTCPSSNRLSTSSVFLCLIRRIPCLYSQEQLRRNW